MFFTVTLYLSLTIFVLGALYKAGAWFRLGLTTADRRLGVGERLSAVSVVVARVPRGTGLPALTRTFFLDVLLLRRSWIQDKYRWAMHMLIFWGFLLLLLFHALEKHISEPLLPGYLSTLNPYLFLREVFGLMVLAGAAMAVYRRCRKPNPRTRTRAMDGITIALLVLLLLSGFLLKGVKIASRSEFTRMVEEYAFIDDQSELRSLESLWVKEYGLISPEVRGPFSEEVLAEGREVNEMYCAHCHSNSGWAFASYAASRLTAPVTARSDGAGLVSLFWYIHVLASFAGLAWLPFGKMFHALVSPLSLLAAASPQGAPAARAVRRVMELDACTSCGACSERCSVGIATESIPNPLILPLEKLRALRSVATGGVLPPEKRAALLEGLVVCTSCNRCSGVCPVGIDLLDLWTAVREDLLQAGVVEPYVLSPLHLPALLRADKEHPESALQPGLVVHQLLEERFGQPEDAVVTAPTRGDTPSTGALFRDQAAFTACFSCRTCTSSCPVTDHVQNPARDLGLLPHQIIHATAMGLHELAASSRMLWACLGCYQCQEQCPQGVPVADVLYAQKQAALAGLKTGDKK